MTKQERREYGKTYYEEHKDHLKTLQRQYRERRKQKKRQYDRKRGLELRQFRLSGDFGRGLTVSAFQNAAAGRTEKYIDEILKGKRFLTMAVER
jgi:hypothetical protein